MGIVYFTLPLMSIFPKELVHNIAESIGITVKDEVANLLIQDTEYRLREIIHVSIY
jgi:transcription initiation factor TFIID subunit 6